MNKLIKFISLTSVVFLAACYVGPDWGSSGYYPAGYYSGYWGAPWPVPVYGIYSSPYVVRGWNGGGWHGGGWHGGGGHGHWH